VKELEGQSKFFMDLAKESRRFVFDFSEETVVHIVCSFERKQAAKFLKYARITQLTLESYQKIARDLCKQSELDYSTLRVLYYLNFQLKGQQAKQALSVFPRLSAVSHLILMPLFS